MIMKIMRGLFLMGGFMAVLGLILRSKREGRRRIWVVEE